MMREYFERSRREMATVIGIAAFTFNDTVSKQHDSPLIVPAPSLQIRRGASA